MVSVEKRYKLLYEAKDNPDLQAKCIAACKHDIEFWFNHFAYTFDPRRKPSDLPFNLMDFQIDVVKAVEDCIRTGEPLIIEKSRDMGATWLVVLVFQYFWMFEPGSDFLIGSKTQDLVDKKGDRSTIFQKLRYNAVMQPSWLLPRLTKNQDTFLKMIHPVNGNTINGTTSTPDFGRSGRYRAAMMDEMAFHPYGRAAFESVSQSTNCIIMPSTPNGKTNYFYTLRSRDDLDWIDIESNTVTLDVA